MILRFDNLKIFYLNNLLFIFLKHLFKIKNRE